MRCVRPLALLVVLALVAIACGREPPVAAPPRSLDVPRIDGGAPSPPSPHGHAKGEVTAGFIHREGWFWGAWYEVTPEPADLVKPCYTEAIATDPSLTGWAMFDVTPSLGGSLVEFAEASPLPKTLLVCLEVALRKMHIPTDGFNLPASLVYVTMR